jgi:hypothetical protein
MFPVKNPQSGHCGHDVRERINACRRRLRRNRAAAARSGCCADRGESPALSVDEESPAGWMEEEAGAAVDHGAPPRARFEREEETVRA